MFYSLGSFFCHSGMLVSHWKSKSQVVPTVMLKCQNKFFRSPNFLPIAEIFCNHLGVGFFFYVHIVNDITVAWFDMLSCTQVIIMSDHFFQFFQILPNF
jgi:hypothetical protein